MPKVLARHAAARFVFLTLTQKNVPVGDLRRTLGEMNRAWSRLAQTKSFRIVLGWIRSTEVTRGASGTAYPHFHVLLMVCSNYFTKNYRKQSQWVEMWRKALRIDYSPIVDVRPVKVQNSRDRGILPALRETLKYSVKPADMITDFGWFLEITHQLTKLRFIAAGGFLKDVLRPEEETEKDLLGLRSSDTPDEKASVFFRWKKVPKRYKRLSSAEALCPAGRKDR
jgi:plasmid rolling circle replication initiator protein Rep